MVNKETFDFCDSLIIIIIFVLNFMCFVNDIAWISVVINRSTVDVSSIYSVVLSFIGLVISGLFLSKFKRPSWLTPKSLLKWSVYLFSFLLVVTIPYVILKIYSLINYNYQDPTKYYASYLYSITSPSSKYTTSYFYDNMSSNYKFEISIAEFGYDMVQKQMDEQEMSANVVHEDSNKYQNVV
ncbi:hypothetical protein F8M41_004791 [Gigaspora margarita]|uniref:Uncharacterized protein n=1 Tax=Gigaspora margarita TaxID=4874 RepID=A0A8H3XBR8_GIGMA|nr:hypothetical protein F8M41_004791 [Gigaspora margarita]